MGSLKAFCIMYKHSTLLRTLSGGISAESGKFSSQKSVITIIVPLIPKAREVVYCLATLRTICWSKRPQPPRKISRNGPVYDLSKTKRWHHTLYKSEVHWYFYISICTRDIYIYIYIYWYRDISVWSIIFLNCPKIKNSPVISYICKCRRLFF